MCGEPLDGVLAVRAGHARGNRLPSGGSEAAVDGSVVDGDLAADLDGRGRRGPGAGLGDVIEGNPADAGFELAPFGRAGAVCLRYDGIDAGGDEALAPVVGAGAAADVEVGGRHLDGVVGGGLLAAGGGCARGGAPAAEALIDFRCDAAVPVVEVVSGAGLGSVVAVNSHIAAADVVDAVVLDSRPHELLDAVPLADVLDKVQKGLVCLVGDGPVRSSSVVGDLDGDGSLVVRSGRGAPRAVRLRDVEGDAPVAADAVVAGCLSAALGKKGSARFDGKVAGHAVDRDGVDGVGSVPGVVRAELGVANEGAVTHLRRPPSRRRRAWHRGSSHPLRRRPRHR